MDLPDLSVLVGLGVERGDLTNAAWVWLEMYLPSPGQRGGRWNDHRSVINGAGRWC